MTTAPRMHRTSAIACTLVLLLLIAIGIAPTPSQASTARGDAGCQPSPDGGLKPALRADTAKPCPPDLAGGAAEPRDAGARAAAPAPGSKNATVPNAFDPSGVTRSDAPARGQKTDANTRAGLAPQAPTITSASTAGGVITSCHAAGGGGWTTTSASWQVIRSCTLDIPEAGFVYLDASASVGLSSDVTPFEARFGLNVDGAAGNGTTDRWVNVYTDSGDGTDKSVADNMIQPISAGSHTFYFLGTRYAGTGTVQLYNPSLSVLYFPSSVAEVLSCGVTSNLSWSTSSTSFQEIRSCALTLPQDGFVFVNGTASAGLLDTPFEARIRLGLDSTTGTASSDRWVNVNTDSGDGTDETVATSLLTSASAGAHTFYFLGTRYNGTGTVQLYDPSLTVIYFPASSATMVSCGASGSDVWTNSTTSYTVIRSCSLSVPEPSFAFMNASASAGLNATGAGNEWEGQFRFGVDNSTFGTSGFDRWINVYNDSGDGTDEMLAGSGVVDVISGTHTFYFLGKRYAGTGTLRLYSPSLTVLALNGQPRISAIPDQSIPESTATSAIPFTVGDGNTSAISLTLSAVSSNPALVPNDQIVFGGAEMTRTVTITPTAYLTGTATISVTVGDGLLDATSAFTLTVTPNPNIPYISSIASQTVRESTATPAIPFTLADADTPAASLIVSASSSNTTLVPNSNIALAGTGANRTVKITPAQFQAGATTITLTVADGTFTRSTTFLLTVTPDFKLRLPFIRR